MIVVVSTAFGPPPDARARCLESVRAQLVADKHVYIDASTQDPPRAHFENLLVGTACLDPNTVVVCLDGDDWLLPGSLERVEREYIDHPETLCTYGSYQFADGRPGHARELYSFEWSQLRSSPWVASHLKTFRAHMLRRIAGKDLLYNGQWLQHARDLALMYPILEMAGPEGARFIPDVLYVYNYANSTEFRGGQDVLAAERDQVRHVRGLPSYARLTTAVGKQFDMFAQVT